MRLATLLLLMLFLQACKKQVAGPKGEPGLDGKNGNSNVVTTNAFVIKGSSWDSVIENDHWSWKKTLVLSQLTNSAISDGDIMVYRCRAENDNWYRLPVFEGYLCTQFSFETGLLHLRLTHLHEGIAPRPKDDVYKLVVLSPN